MWNPKLHMDDKEHLLGYNPSDLASQQKWGCLRHRILSLPAAPEILLGQLSRRVSDLLP